MGNKIMLGEPVSQGSNIISGIELGVPVPVGSIVVVVSVGTSVAVVSVGAGTE